MRKTYITPDLSIFEFQPENSILVSSIEKTEEEMDGADFMTNKKQKTIWNSEPGKFK